MSCYSAGLIIPFSSVHLGPPERMSRLRSMVPFGDLSAESTSTASSRSVGMAGLPYTAIGPMFQTGPEPSFSL